MEERKLTERESIEVITSMIERTKERYIGNGNILLMWGYLVVAVTLLVWVLLVTTRYGAWNWLWVLIPVIGFPATIIMARKEQRECGATTYSDKVTSKLWTVAGGSELVTTLFCLGFALFAGVNCWSVMLGYTLVMMPFAEIAQGIIIKERSLIYGGLFGFVVGIFTLCCIAGGVPLYVNWFLPLFMLCFIAMMIIPGHIINHKAGRRR